MFCVDVDDEIGTVLTGELELHCRISACAQVHRCKLDSASTLGQSDGQVSRHRRGLSPGGQWESEIHDAERLCDPVPGKRSESP